LARTHSTIVAAPVIILIAVLDADSGGSVSKVDFIVMDIVFVEVFITECGTVVEGVGGV
jgi:hypothetical protein